MPPLVSRKRGRSSSPAAEAPPTKRNGTAKGARNKPGLFSTVDQKTHKTTLEDNQAYLNALGEDDESALSDLSSSNLGSDEFEDIPSSPAGRRRVEHCTHDDDDDEEMVWEDAIGRKSPSARLAPARPIGDLELTLDETTKSSAFSRAAGSKKGPSKIERQIRDATHRLHVQYLMWHNSIRNTWINDEEVHQILVGHLTEGLKKDVQKYRRNAGLPDDPRFKTTDDRHKAKINGKAKASRKHDAKDRNERDWGRDSDRLEEGVPNLSRGDKPLVDLLKVLAPFWRSKFAVTAPGLRKQGYSPLDRLNEKTKVYRQDQGDEGQFGENIANIEEFQKHAKTCTGSRDLQSQLFTAFLRALGLEARMVASLQPIGFGWSKSEEAGPPKYKARGIAEDRKSAAVGEEDGDHESDVSARQPTHVTSRAMPHNIRQGVNSVRPLKKSAKQSPRRQSKDGVTDLECDESSLSSVLLEDDDDASVIDITPAKPSRNRSSKRFDSDLPFPIYWTEVLSPASNRYIPVDPSRKTVANSPELLATFEPRGTAAEKAKQVLAYVVAFNADSTAKDVTTRYLKRHMWPGKTKGVRIPIEKVPVYNRRGKVLMYKDRDWFSDIIFRGYTVSGRPKSEAEEIEDETDLKPIKPQLKAAPSSVPETLQGYKSSAEFVLERHLRREEAIIPAAQPVKQFVTGKGEKAKSEPVYRRADVATCKTVESWHKEGRQIRPREQPLKHVPTRAVTLLRKREIEEAERETGEKLKQALYAKSQTEWIIPPPIQDGVIPKNAFGNMDVYVHTMVPKGAVHIALKGTARVCRKLEIDHAEACTGFEFGNKRAVPVLTGVVVAEENYGLVMDAWRKEEQAKSEREEAKQGKLILDMWKKFFKGLRILERVRQEYGDMADKNNEINPFVNKDKKKGRVDKLSKRRVQNTADYGHGGGDSFDAHDHASGPGDDDALGQTHLDEEAVGGGFIVNEDHDYGGGGFVVDERSPQPCKGDIVGPNDYPRTPQSLAPMPAIQQTEADGASAAPYHNGEDENDEPAKLSVKKREKARKTRLKKQSQHTGHQIHMSSPYPQKTPSSKTPSLITGNAPERAATDQAEEETLPEPSSEEMPQAPPTEQRRGNPRPQRAAARNSANAVRSHFFRDEADDDQSDGL